MTDIIGAPTLDDALAVLREQISANEARGERNLIFCEDRLTLLAERAVLSAVGGTFLTEVTTFSRYLSRPGVLSKEGSVMILSSIIAEGEGKLVFFRERAAQAVYETIAQLAASRVTPETLTECAEECEGMLRGKLLDLAYLFSEYTERLRACGLLDENGYLALLPERLRRGELGSVNIFFFGFRSFTQQACEGVRAAIESAKKVTGIFTAGRSELYTNEGARVFRRVAEEYGEAHLRQVGCSLHGAALALQGGLFSPERLSLPKTRTDGVRRFAGMDEAEELGAVASLIKKHVAEGVRYREIAVLSDGEESFSAVGKVFSAYRIPYFADKKRAFSEHPFCVFVLAVLSAVTDGVLPDEADAVASSVYFGNGDNYRNYLLKYGGYRGAVRREIKEGDAVKGYRREELTAARERMLGILKCFPRKGTGAAFTEGVRALSAFVGAEETTEELKTSFTGAEREFLDLSRLDGVLGEIDALAGEKSFTVREFRETLQSGLSALSVSMIPQNLDAVFVGDLTESKFERVRILFATGLTDAVPRVSQDTAVITDGEIRKLGGLQVEIEPAIAQVNARARESLALNLCAFTDALYLSYPMRKGGSETEPSEIFRYAEGLFDMPPMPELFPYDCCEEEPAALRLLSLKRDFESGRETDNRKYSALFALLEGEGKDLARLLGGGEKAKVPEAGELVFAGDLSPTLLEQYFSCPYSGFAVRALRLREREERTVLDTDAGTFVHAVLQRAAERFNDMKDEAACRAFAVETGETLLRQRFSALSDTAAGAYTARRLVEEGAEVSVAAFRQLIRSSFRVKETEGKISLPELFLSGMTDRIDVSDDFVRVIDYKTGRIDDSPSAYYTGRKLQLELYLRGASRGYRPAGAFYFPAADNFAGKEEEKFRMSGFFSGEDEVLVRMDPSLAEGERSLLFEGKRDGKYTDKSMKQEDFEAFLDYSVLLSQRAENEIREGNIAPSPYENTCAWCKLRSLCGFVGTPRKESAIRCAEIVEIVRRTRGEK